MKRFFFFLKKMVKNRTRIDWVVAEKDKRRERERGWREINKVKKNAYDL